MGNKTIIIAEAGVNHNGDMDMARQLIDAAAEAGVDYVKFQTFKASKLASKHAEKAKYQSENMGEGGTQLEMLRKLELSEAAHEEIIHYCQKKGVNFLSTAFDTDSIDLLRKFGVRLGKVPSGEVTNLPYLRKMAASFEEIILSTGMSNLEEVGDAVKVLLSSGMPKESISILHCNTQYPTPMEDVNLRAMNTLAEAFQVKVGYSDHTLGIEVPIAAVAMGAVIIEKHFTLDRNLPGPDHKASLEPGDLKEMVRCIRNIEKALGSGVKEMSHSESANVGIARKSIVAAKRIPAGEMFSVDNLEVKRPGTGISPMLWDEVIGQRAKRDFEEDELIEL
jgi:N,N'-diacetyllegionaminate synthase